MGWSCSWIAVRGKEEASILGALGLRRPRGLELPDLAWRYGWLDDGWLVVLSDRSAGPPEFEPDRLAELSTGGELIHVCVEEHTMWTLAAGWEGGRETWSVEHDSQQARDHLTASGDLPSAYPALRDERLADQAEETRSVDHFFEIPLNLAEELTGFRHDDAALQGLVSASGAAKPWWKIW